MRLQIVGFIVVVMLLCGCQRSVQSPSKSQNFENEYVKILNELTTIMSAKDDPTSILANTRAYVTENKSRVSNEINELNRALLNMPEDERNSFKTQVTPSIEKMLDAYAQAQLNLKKRMNEAQQWELSEILSQLR